MNCPLFSGNRWVIVNPRDPIVFVSELANDYPIPMVSSWFIGDFTTGEIVSETIDCGDMNGCLTDNCSPSISPTLSPETKTPSSSPSSSPSYVPISVQPSHIPSNGPTIEPIIERCVTVTIECNST